MDPNVTLENIREIVKKWNDESSFDVSDMAIIVSHFDWLDTWLTKGGFLPQAWEKHCQDNVVVKKQ